MPLCAAKSLLGKRKIDLVSQVADGTDGEMLTWDANGDAALVATGTAGQLLASGGAGVAPAFTSQIDAATTIDVTSTEALLVRQNADAADVFIVDTTNQAVGVNAVSSLYPLNVSFSEAEVITGSAIRTGAVKGVRIINSDETTGSGATITFSAGGGSDAKGAIAVMNDGANVASMGFFLESGASMVEAATFNAAGDLSVNNTTASTSTTTGALKVAGGLGVAGTLVAATLTGDSETVASGDNAVSPATPVTIITGTSTTTTTLADGAVQGTMKKIVFTGASGALCTPTTSTGFETITTGGVGTGVDLVWITTSGWVCTGNNGATLA